MTTWTQTPQKAFKLQNPCSLNFTKSSRSIALYSLLRTTKTLQTMRDIKRTGNLFTKTTVKQNYGLRVSTTVISLKRGQSTGFLWNKLTEILKSCLHKPHQASTTKERKIGIRSLMVLALCSGSTKYFLETSARASAMEPAVSSLLKMEELSKSLTTQMGYSTGTNWRRT
jgi:hypothetical protein